MTARRDAWSKRGSSAAREVLDLFAPLANRLGVWQLKWELEDLSLRALEPEAYKTIAALLDERRLDRQRYIEDVIAILRARARGGRRARGDHRPAEAHLQHLAQDAPQAVGHRQRCTTSAPCGSCVDDVKDCYAALGSVHHLWTPLPREFDDYIAKPKANDYRSLHTAVIGPEGKPLEVQIRTREMHQHSEYGVAAHWRYKEGAQKGVRRDPAFEDRIAWLRQVLDWKDAVADASEWLAAFRSSLFTDTIYVLTPQGKVVDLPRGLDAGRFRVRRAHGASAIAAAARASTARWCRSITRSRTASASKSSPRSRAVRRATGSIRSSAMRTATAPAPRSGSGSRRSSTRKRSPRAARSSSASSRARARPRSSLDAVAVKAGFARADELYAAVGRAELNTRQISHGDQGRLASRRRVRGRKRAGGGRPAEQGGRRRQRHPRRRRRPADDQSRALLQARAARWHRRLRHPRQGRDDPPPEAAATSCACARASPKRLIERGLGRAAR